MPSYEVLIQVSVLLLLVVVMQPIMEEPFFGSMEFPGILSPAVDLNSYPTYGELSVKPWAKQSQ